MSCLLCNHTLEGAVVVNTVARDNIPQTSVRCHACGLVQVDVLPSEETLNEYYVGGEYRRAHPSILNPNLKPGMAGYQATLDPSFIARRANRIRLKYNLAPDSKVFEVGAGSGYTAFALKEMCRIQDVFVSDLDPQFFENYKDLGLKLSDDPECKDNSLVYSSHVLEHSTNPIVHVQYLASMAHPFYGQVMVEVPDVEKFTSSDQYQFAHLTNFNQSTLRLCLERAGLAQVWVEEFGDFLMAGGSV